MNVSSVSPELATTRARQQTVKRTKPYGTRPMCDCHAGGGTASSRTHRWLVMTPQPAPLAMRTASMDSVTEPIWFTFNNSALHHFSLIAFATRTGFVTSRSSPTIWWLGGTHGTRPRCEERCQPHEYSVRCDLTWQWVPKSAVVLE